MTTQQINQIAKKTKQVCDKNGYGHQVVVFADGRANEAIGPNDRIAADSGDGWEYPIARLRYPMSRAQVREEIEQAETELARRQLEAHSAGWRPAN